VLNDFYAATNGASWTLPGSKWNTSAPLAEWQGVACTGPDVTAIALNGVGLTGTLPSSLSMLLNLTSIQLTENNIMGTLPESWAALVLLRALIMYSNSLSGTLPAAWSALTQLTVVALYGNQLEGSLPASWSALVSLTELVLYNNLFSGTLPAEWSSMTKMRSMYLFDNHLAGGLPASWAAMTQLQLLLLADNYLTGFLPAEWSALTQIITLWLQGNHLHGTLPWTWAAMTAIREFNIRRNAFSGSIPESWATAMRKLVLFDAAGNNLNGSFPVYWLSCAANTTKIDVSYNSLSGVAAGAMAADIIACGKSTASGAAPRLNFCGNKNAINANALQALKENDKGLEADLVIAILFPGYCFATPTNELDATLSTTLSPSRRTLSLTSASETSTHWRSSSGTVTETHEILPIETPTWSQTQSLTRSLLVTPSATAVPQAPPPLLSATAKTATKAAVFVSGIAGPTGASDVQATAALALVPCRARKQAEGSNEDGFGALSPVALDDTAQGVLGGNALLIAGVTAAQLLAVLFFIQCRGRSVPEACEGARFPGLGHFSFSATLLQGTIVSSAQLLSHSSVAMVAAGCAGLAWCALLVGVVVAAVRWLPRRFVRYDYVDATSRYARWRVLLPVGLILPSSVRKAASGLVCAYTTPTALAAVSPFVSPVTLSALFFIPSTASAGTCQAAMWGSCGVHAVMAVVALRFHRNFVERLLHSASLILTVIAHFMTIANDSKSLDTMVVVQAVFAATRSAATLTLFVAETVMQAQAAAVEMTDHPLVLTDPTPLWMVGDGGLRFESTYAAVDKGVEGEKEEEEAEEGEEDHHHLLVLPQRKAFDDDGSNLREGHSIKQPSAENASFVIESGDKKFEDRRRNAEQESDPRLAAERMTFAAPVGPRDMQPQLSQLMRELFPCRAPAADAQQLNRSSLDAGLARLREMQGAAEAAAPREVARSPSAYTAGTRQLPRSPSSLIDPGRMVSVALRSLVQQAVEEQLRRQRAAPERRGSERRTNTFREFNEEW
jgi:hypothetical protein